MNTEITHPINIRVMICGFLTRDKLSNIRTALSQNLAHSNAPVEIEINSEGGNAPEGLKLFNYFEKFGSRISTRIITAKSTAAVLAFLGNHRLMKRSGLFGIHLGEVRFEANELVGGNIPQQRIDDILEFRRLNLRLLREKALIPNILYARLHAQNHIILTANQCLEFGIVQELFD